MKKFIASAILLIGLIGTPLLASVPAYAVDCAKDPTAAGCPCAGNSDSTLCKQLSAEKGGTGFNSNIKNITNILLFGFGLLAVLVIIIASIRFTSSHGDPSAVAKARMIITYSVIGLVVAMSAAAIVNFTLGQI